MTTVKLDETLIYQTKRRTREGGLTPEERIAINLLWRKKVRVPVLAKVFGVSKNTAYYKALTGTAGSYPTTGRSNSAAETNAVIDKLGFEVAWARYVTDKMITAINAENKRELERRKRKS